MRETTVKVGSHREHPRIYLEGKWLDDVGFSPGSTCQIEFGSGRITIRAVTDGNHKVTPKKGHGVIDIESNGLATALNGATTVRVVAEAGTITITPTKSLLKAAVRTLVGVAVSLYAGAGLMDQAAANAGFETRAAVEVDTSYAQIWEANHRGDMYASPVEEVDFYEMSRRIGPVGLLLAGRPCEPFSQIRTIDRGGQQRRDRQLPPEAHELGHLDFYTLQAVDALNPHTVIIENVPSYLTAASGYIVQGVLRAMRYTVDARILNALDYGALTARRRAVVIATMNPAVQWPLTNPNTRTAGEILEDVPADDPRWFGEDHWVVKHWLKQTEKGNGFAAPAINAQSTSIPTLKKRYFAGQGDNFVVEHPTKPNTWRWLTLEEGRRLMELPDDYDLGTTKTIAGEALGQGVVVGFMSQLIRANCPLQSHRGSGIRLVPAA